MLGAPGCGKATQAKRIMGRYGIPRVSVTDVVREALTEGTPFGALAQAAVDAGQPVSDEIILGMIRERLAQSDTEQGFILEGFPRTLPQAQALDILLNALGQALQAVLWIDLDIDVLMERLEGRRTCMACGQQYNVYTNPPTVDGMCDKCGGQVRRRADDNEETIHNRFRAHESLVAPLLEYYGEQNKLRRIDGAGTVDEVFRRARKVLDEAKREHAKLESVARAATALRDEVVTEEPVAAVEQAAEKAERPVERRTGGKGRQRLGKAKSGKTAGRKAPAGSGSAKKLAKTKKRAAKTAGTVSKGSLSSKARKKKKAVAAKPTTAKEARVATKTAKKTVGKAAAKKAVARKTLAKKTAKKAAQKKAKTAVKKVLVKKAAQKKKSSAKKKAVGRRTSPASTARKPTAKKSVMKKKRAKTSPSVKKANLKKVSVKKKAVGKTASNRSKSKKSVPAKGPKGKRAIKASTTAPTKTRTSAGRKKQETAKSRRKSTRAR
jgi:adenylate kinase